MDPEKNLKPIFDKISKAWMTIVKRQPLLDFHKNRSLLLAFDVFQHTTNAETEESHAYVNDIDVFPLRGSYNGFDQDPSVVDMVTDHILEDIAIAAQSVS